MDKDLPKGWVSTKLGEIFTIVTGNTPSKKYPEYYDGDIPWVKPADINRSTVLYETENYLSKLGSEKSRMLPKGAVMVTCIGNLGYVAIAGTECATNQQINSIVDDSGKFNTKFIYYFSFGLKQWLIENSTSTTISMVNKSTFSKAPFYFPSRPEQDRIVAKVDVLMAQVATMQKSLERIPQLLKDFRQQVLNLSYSSKETRVALEDCCIKIQDGAHHSPKNVYPVRGKNMFPYITSKNIRNNYMKLDTLTYVDKEYHDTIYPRCKPELDDVLLTKDGANTGNVTLNEFDEPVSLLSSVCLIKTDRSKLIPNYLKYFIQSPIGFREFTGQMTGTAIKRVVLKKIKKGTIPLPTLDKQIEIVNRVESLFAKADKIETQYKSLKAKIDNLPQAILHKAFKGELVEQLPTDGDAKDLLREIEVLKKNKLRK